MEDFEISDMSLPRIAPQPPRIGTSYRELCVVDWCVETIAVSHEDTESFWFVNEEKKIIELKL